MKKIITFVLCFFLFSSLIAQNKLATESRGVFYASGNCAYCHNGNSKALKIKGKDVSPPVQWRSAMMGNAAKDPFWRAKVDIEINSLKNNTLKKAAGDLCLKCHSPMAYTNAADNNITDYNFEKSLNDELARDGVSCSLCHQISSENLGNSNSYAGNYLIKKDMILWGPYENPFSPPMFSYGNYRHEYSAHIKKAELCATCHTVITPFVDENENIQGTFFEQTPYLEWKNSFFPENGIVCQSCHMPEVSDSVDIAAIPPSHEVYRTPYWFHTFAGGNNTMQKIFINNGSELGLTTEKEHHEATLKAVEENLTESALSLSAKAFISEGVLKILVTLENQTGHKLPTGIPFRRMWVHLTVKGENGNTLFESGKYDSEGNITGLDESFEPHYDIIKNENQVQVYEGILGDMQGVSTFSLLRAAKFLKDNRIPPSGFTTGHYTYDSVAIYGNALQDTDFNRKGNEEGTGTDIIKYEISPAGNNKFTIEVEICYQSIKPEILKYLEKYSSDFAVKYIKMQKETGLTPTIMKKLKLEI